MDITYLSNQPYKDFDKILNLYAEVDWTVYTNNPQSLQHAIENSSYTVQAYHNENLVGFARSLSDDVSIHYLQDILVHPNFQRQGIGKHLVELLLERYAHVNKHVLLTDDDQQQHAFYQSLQFKKLPVKLEHFTLNGYVKP